MTIDLLTNPLARTAFPVLGRARAQTGPWKAACRNMIYSLTIEYPLFFAIAKPRSRFVSFLSLYTFVDDFVTALSTQSAVSSSAPYGPALG